MRQPRIHHPLQISQWYSLHHISMQQKLRQYVQQFFPSYGLKPLQIIDSLGIRTLIHLPFSIIWLHLVFYPIQNHFIEFHLCLLHPGQLMSGDHIEQLRKIIALQSEQ